MFSLLELRGQSSLLHKTGSVEINTDYYRRRRPAWLVMLKLMGVAAMVGIGFAIAVPTLLEFNYPLWQAIPMSAGGMVVYTLVAFFIHPEANTDNLGLGGGMGNDPFQSSDNVNRFLWRAHCVLGPGRFTAETFLDVCILLGLAKGAEIVDEVQQISFSGYAPGAPGSFDATQPIAPLDPNRFAQSSGNFVAGQIQLDSQRFLNSPPQPPAAAR
jgi:hypothetical protein